MIKIIGVRFRNVGKVYYFDPKELQIKAGDHVIVETARGVEYGRVVLGTREVPDDQVVQPLKEVIRLATPKDQAREESNRKKEKEAYQICLKKIEKHHLDMKLIHAEYTFDNNKVLFYFTADGRVDFRELIKDLASVFRTRIELRQIGVRDETKLLGGLGICGRPLCCSTYLSDFVPVSIRMAKEQNLSLNPSKISGTCGRLMCCLKNEQETYEYLNKNLPRNGDLVTTPEGESGEVNSVNVLRQTVRVLVEVGDDKEMREYPAGELKWKQKPKKPKEKPKEKAKEKPKEKNKEKSREKNKEKSREKSRQRDPEKQEQDRPKEKNREKSRERGKERERNQEKNLKQEEGKARKEPERPQAEEEQR